MQNFNFCGVGWSFWVKKRHFFEIFLEIKIKIIFSIKKNPYFFRLKRIPFFFIKKNSIFFFDQKDFDFCSIKKNLKKNPNFLHKMNIIPAASLLFRINIMGLPFVESNSFFIECRMGNYFNMKEWSFFKLDKGVYPQLL